MKMATKIQLDGQLKERFIEWLNLTYTDRGQRFKGYDDLLKQALQNIIEKNILDKNELKSKGIIKEDSLPNSLKEKKLKRYFA